MDINRLIRFIDQNLTKEIKLKLNKERQVSVAFSGGIDSTAIVIKLLKLDVNPILITTGSSLSKDIDYVKRFAKDFNLPLKYIPLSRRNLREIDEIIYLLTKHTPDKLKTLAEKIRFKYPGLSTYPNAMDAAIALCFKHIALNSPSKFIFTGHGAGDLFGGTLRATQVGYKQLSSYLEYDSIISGKIDIFRDSFIVKFFANKILINPIFNKELIKFARTLPNELKIHKTPGGKILRKYIWTKYAEFLGVPHYIVNRTPKSMQYSCGIYKWVMKYLKTHPELQTTYYTIKPNNS